MYTKLGPGAGIIDSVIAVEGTFKWNPKETDVPELEVLMLYMNSTTGKTCGTCKVTPGILTKKTVEAFQNFLRSAEEDFGQFVFENATVKDFGPIASGAESPKGLPKGLGEG